MGLALLEIGDIMQVPANRIKQPTYYYRSKILFYQQ